LRTRFAHPVRQTHVELRSGGGTAATAMHLAVRVGQARWSDLSGLRGHISHLPPDDFDPLSSNRHHVVAILKDLLPFAGYGQRIFVARSGGRPVGFIVFTVLGPDQRWVVSDIGASLGVYAAEPVLEELVHHGVVAAGLEGTKRLYSRVPTSSPILASFRRCGFAPYTTETILGAPMMPVPTGPTRGRRQLSNDVWSIHQLYLASVPRQVQYAEALTSHHWDIERQGWSGTTRNGWLVEDGYQAVGYVKAASNHRAHTLEFMMHPDHRKRFPDLIGTVAKDLESRLARPARVIVRNYQQEYVSYLREIGFAVQLEQELQVKYTTAPVRAPANVSVTFASDLKEPVGKRVPTFLVDGPSDPSSEAS